ncbi:hypothetical protein ACVOMV_18685 [Mesorhizobium atlanticum]
MATAAFELEHRGWRSFPEPPHAIVSSLAIHHLDDRQKRMLFADLGTALQPRRRPRCGRHCAPAGRGRSRHRGAAVGRGCAFAGARDRRRPCSPSPSSTASAGTISAIPTASRIDKPSSLAEQLSWLSEAGFIAVDCAWLFAGHAIFSGLKA